MMLMMFTSMAVGKPIITFPLTLNAPIATKIVCFSHLLKCLSSLYGKQCGPRLDCSYRSSLFWVHAVCFYTEFVSNNGHFFCSRRLQQTTFSDVFFLGAFRVKKDNARCRSQLKMISGPRREKIWFCKQQGCRLIIIAFVIPFQKAFNILTFYKQFSNLGQFISLGDRLESRYVRNQLIGFVSSWPTSFFGYNVGLPRSLRTRHIQHPWQTQFYAPTLASKKEGLYPALILRLFALSKGVGH